MDVHRAARIAHAGHGGQVLLSATTAPLVRGELPAGVALLTLGRHRLKDMKYPERITQLVIDDLPSEFPPLTSLEALPSDDPLSLKSAHLPAFLEEAEAEPQPPVFVARELELDGLNSTLKNAVEGQGRVVFVTGGPGRGKTALLEEFGRLSIDTYPDLLVVGGECSAYRGIGDPYLPFRRMMAMLTGDVEAEWASGAINREDALRLWDTMPSTARAIVEYGPDLINLFVSGRDLMARVNAAVDIPSSWREQLGKLTERYRSETPDIEQRNLFEQYVQVIKSITADHPLVLILDDMQWADGASLNLLFHLGRRLEGERILIVGAYRPEEVALGRGDSPHPLEKILAEFKRQFGEIEVDLGKTGADESRHFVDAYIDSERNRLSPDFRAALFAHTEGHPLFTVELMRNLQERGDIVQDSDGVWVETGELDWSVLPARVEGVIEERISRLEDELKETLTVASVEGVDFTAQIVARGREVKERALIRQLSQELDKVHRLVQEHGILEILKQRLYQYRFRHQMFQQHLYNGLGDFERTELHREVGSILEDVYGDRARDIAPQLAYHFTKAGESNRALIYLIQTGDQARMIYANAEAIDFYQQAVRILEQSSDNDQLARTLMKLGLVYTANYQPDEARKAYDRAFSLWETRRESSTLDETPLPINILRMAVDEPLNFDPGIMSDDSSTFIANQMYEGLTTIDHE
ncbi:MAG: AAA family ATPase, partial [Anaerolineales bacterium]|nr:AAA family ATPase [Anaerolineales bacterium]